MSRFAVAPGRRPARFVGWPPTPTGRRAATGGPSCSARLWAGPRLRTGRSALTGTSVLVRMDAHRATGGPMPETIEPILTSIQAAARLDDFSLAPPRPGGPAGRLYASVSIPCPRGGARRACQDDSGLGLQSGPRRRSLAHGRSRLRRDDFRPRRFDEGEDPDLRRPDQIATEWTCHAGPGCRAPTNGAEHGISSVGTSPSRWVGEGRLPRCSVFPRLRRE